jgi:hypothetical protein
VKKAFLILYVLARLAEMILASHFSTTTTTTTTTTQIFVGGGSIILN